MAVVAQGLDDAQLVLRADAGVNGIAAHRIQQLGVVHLLQLRPAYGPGPRLHNAQLSGNRRGRHWVVAGDHDHADACTLRRGDRRLGLRARRVDDAQNADKDQFLLQRLHFGVGCGLIALMRNAAVGDAQRAQRLGGQLLDRGQNLRPPFFSQRAHLVAATFVRAARQQHIGSTLGDHGHRICVLGVGLHCAHQLAVGGEGHLADAGKALVHLFGADADLARRHHQRRLGRVALDSPGTLLLFEHGVVRQRAAQQRTAHIGQQDWVGRLLAAAVQQHLPLRCVADAGQFHASAGGDDGAHGHLVLGQRARLVRADDRGRTERLHRRQLAHDGVALDHALHAQRQHDRENGRQPFGHGGHGQRNAQQQRLHQPIKRTDLAHQQDRGDDDDGNDHHADAQQLAHACDLQLERGLFFGRGLHQPGDLAHFRLHGRGGDHGLAAAKGGDRAAKDHIDAVADAGFAADRRDILGDGLAFARQGRLGHLQRGDIHQAAVGSDGVALLDQQNIAGDQVERGDLLLFAVAQHRGHGRGHLLQRGHGGFGAFFLKVTDNGIEQHDGDDR